MATFNISTTASTISHGSIRQRYTNTGGQPVYLTWTGGNAVQLMPGGSAVTNATVILSPGETISARTHSGTSTLEVLAEPVDVGLGGTNGIAIDDLIGSGILGYLRTGEYYYCSSTGAAQTVATLGVGTLRLTPMWIPQTVTLAKVGAEVTSAGEAGSKFRIGIYADSGQHYPGPLVLDAGTINGDSATVQEITISERLPAGLYWFGGAVQVVATTQPTMRCTQNWSPPIPTTLGTSAPSAVNTAGLSQTGVTGALPTEFSDTIAVITQAPRIFIGIA